MDVGFDPLLHDEDEERGDGLPGRKISSLRLRDNIQSSSLLDDGSTRLLPLQSGERFESWPTSILN